MRILTLCTPPGHCGIGDYGGEISDSLGALGHQVGLIELLRQGDRTPPIHEFATRLGDYDAAIVQHENSFFGDAHVDIFDNFTKVLRALQRSRKPAIALMHSDMFVTPRRPVLRPWSRAARDRTARRAMINAINHTPRLRALVHSEASRQSWIKIGVSPQQIVTITFAVRPAHTLVEPRPLSDTDTVELAIFGFVAEHKGYEVALKAMRLLPENYVLTIAGEACHPNIRILDAIYGFLHTGEWVNAEAYPPVRPIPRRYTERERQLMLKRVRITGYVEPGRIPELMARADILLLPYRVGPSGSAALGAALAFARPTIASAVEAFRNIARQTDCFRIVAIDAPYQLAETIREVAMDINQRRRMFNACRAFAEANSFDVLARKCAQTLLELERESASNFDPR